MASNTTVKIICTVALALVLLGISGGCGTSQHVGFPFSCVSWLFPGGGGPPPCGPMYPGGAPYGYYPTCWRAWPEPCMFCPMPQAPPEAGAGPEVVHGVEIKVRDPAPPGSVPTEFAPPTFPPPPARSAPMPPLPPAPPPAARSVPMPPQPPMTPPPPRSVPMPPQPPMPPPARSVPMQPLPPVTPPPRSVPMQPPPPVTPPFGSPPIRLPPAMAPPFNPLESGSSILRLLQVDDVPLDAETTSGAGD